MRDGVLLLLLLLGLGLAVGPGHRGSRHLVFRRARAAGLGAARPDATTTQNVISIFVTHLPSASHKVLLSILDVTGGISCAARAWRRRR